MKKLFFLIMLFLSTAFCLAQDMNHTMYVYRNDGGFDAFLFSDIDSITYSKIGTDGYEYDNYVVQEICTADSIYRIPLAAIDSVGLVTPPTIINRDVFSLTNAHVPYIVKADTISFVMSKSTPADMLPAKGNIVAAEADCTAFPNGIIARIVDIDETNQGYEFECEKATIDDVYDQIVFYGKSENESESDTTGFSMMAPQQISDTITGYLWNTDFEHTWNYSGTTTDVKANDMAYWSVKICKTLLRPLTAEIILTNSLTSSISFNAKSEADVSPAPVQIGPTLKVGRITFPHPLLKFIWFEPQISLYGYFEEKGSVELDLNAYYNRKDAIAFRYIDGNWNFDYTNTSEPSVEVASLSMDGYAEVGLQPEILIALNGSATGLGMAGKFGVKQTAEFKFDMLEAMDSGIYDAMKESTAKTYRTMSALIFAQAGFTKQNTERADYPIAETEELIAEKYILPIFKEDYQISNTPNHVVALMVERDLIVPVNLDMVLYDENDNLIQQTNDNDTYKDTDANSFYYNFSGIEKGKKYTAYPLVKIGAVVMRATPGITLDYCPAEITDIKMIDAYYVREEANPNYMNFEAQASLPDMEYIEEWGVYVDDVSYPFESVANSNTSYYHFAIPEYGNDVNARIDYSNFVFEINDRMGVYVKKRNPVDGTLKLLKGPEEEFTLRYDTKPSVIISNPEITDTQIIGSTEDEYGNIVFQKKTNCSFTLSIAGSFWIDYIDAGSGGDGSLIENNKFSVNQDGAYSSSITTTYWENSNYLNHTIWYIIHPRNNSITINSNYLNFYGSNGTLTHVEVSSTPANVKVNNIKKNEVDYKNSNYMMSGNSFIPLSTGNKYKHNSIRLSLDD